ncbi:ester cyclase [Nakamurella sp. GG22]
MPETSTQSDIAHDLAIRDFRLMENWDDAEASAIIAPTMHNDEAVMEPPAARQPGVAGARATYDWLHSAYADLRWTIHTVVAEGDRVVARTTMTGRQTGPFTTFTPDGDVAQTFPPTGLSFATSQTHWFRIADGQLVEHSADRDDLGQALQLGWFGPQSTIG